MSGDDPHGPTLQESQRAVDAEDRYPQMRRAMSDVIAQRDRLRVALVGLVGMDGKAELEAMEAGFVIADHLMRLTPVPAEDKAAIIDAIHALLATCLPPAPNPDDEATRMAVDGK